MWDYIPEDEARMMADVWAIEDARARDREEAKAKDPLYVPGGKALQYEPSMRVRLSKDGDKILADETHHMPSATYKKMVDMGVVVAPKLVDVDVNISIDYEGDQSEFLKKAMEDLGVPIDPARGQELANKMVEAFALPDELIVWDSCRTKT